MNGVCLPMQVSKIACCSGSGVLPFQCPAEGTPRRCVKVRYCIGERAIEGLRPSRRRRA